MSGSSAGTTSEVTNWKSQRQRNDGPSRWSTQFSNWAIRKEKQWSIRQKPEFSTMVHASTLRSMNGVRITPQNPQQEGPSLRSEMWLSPRAWSGRDVPGIFSRCVTELNMVNVFLRCTVLVAARTELPRGRVLELSWLWTAQTSLGPCLRKDFILGTWDASHLCLLLLKSTSLLPSNRQRVGSQTRFVLSRAKAQCWNSNNRGAHYSLSGMRHRPTRKWKLV